MPITGYPPADGVPDVIAAIYETDASQDMINGVYTVVNFEDKVQDTHDAVTTGANWRFTAPVAGFYQVCSRITCSSTSAWTESCIVEFGMRVNDAYYVSFDTQYPYHLGDSVLGVVNGAALVYLNAGGFLDIKVYQNSGGDRSLHDSGSYNYISIVKYAGA